MHARMHACTHAHMHARTQQLAKNLPQFWHRDTHNEGPSLVSTFGEFEGGGLDVHYRKNGWHWTWLNAACEHAVCAV